MAFVRLKNIQGKVFVPESDPNQPRKHTCDDCYCCQLCSDERCQICLQEKECKPCGLTDDLQSKPPANLPSSE